MTSTFSKILRFLLALALLVFGANKFFNFMPLPEMPEVANSFMNSLDASGYILPLIGIIEIFIAILLLLNKWVPFALLLLVPISLNIILFHIFLDFSGIYAALVIGFINLLLIFKSWPAYRSLFK